MVLCLAAFFAAFALQLALNGYQARAVQQVQDDQMSNFNAISRFQGGVESSISILEAYRWENGETTPNIETLKLLSKLFDVSINTLLGSPRQLICQCCGMPLADGDISRETDGFFNEEYCKWCYADGEYMYHDLDDLIEVCVQNMASEEFPAEQARAYLKNTLPKLNYWKRYENLGGAEAFAQYKQTLMDEFNDLHIDGMPKVEKLNALVGKYINLAYRLPNGKTVKFLDDQATYLGNQLECEFGGDRCFGIAANMDFLLVCTYEENGKNPELVVYKKR